MAARSPPSSSYSRKLSPGPESSDQRRLSPSLAAVGDRRWSPTPTASQLERTPLASASHAPPQSAGSRTGSRSGSASTSPILDLMRTPTHSSTPIPSFYQRSLAIPPRNSPPEVPGSAGLARLAAGVADTPRSVESPTNFSR